MNATGSPSCAPPRRSRFVSAIAWGYIAFSLLTLALTTFSLLPIDALAAKLSGESATGGLPAGAAWLVERGGSLALLLSVAACVTLGLSVALLTRRPWARRAFVVLMVAGFVVVLGSAALTPLTFGLLPEAGIGAGIGAAHGEAPMTELIAALGLMIVPATLLVVLFAWTGWMLTTPATKAEFEPDCPAPEG